MNVNITDMTDLNVLKKKLKEINFADLTGNTQNQSMDYILQKITESKRIYTQTRRNQMKVSDDYIPPISWKNFDTSTMKEDVSIDMSVSVYSRSEKSYSSLEKFRPKQKLWDPAMQLNKHLLKKLYRISDCDNSGKSFRHLGRNLAKGVKPWKAALGDKPLPHVTTKLCTPKYRAKFDKMQSDSMNTSDQFLYNGWRDNYRKPQSPNLKLIRLEKLTQQSIVNTLN